MRIGSQEVLTAMLFFGTISAMRSVSNMKYIVYAVILFLISCGRGQALEKISASELITYDQFKAVIHDLQTRGRRDDTSDHWFWKMPETQIIYEKAKFLLPLHRQIWRDPTVIRSEKGLSVQLAQCLSKKDRLNLIADLFSEYKTGVISEDVFTTFLSPGTEWDSWLVLKYKDTQVREALLRISNDPLASKLTTETIASTLDGTGFDFLKEYGSDVAQKLKCDKY